MADGEELGLLEVTSCPGTHTIQIITDSNVDAHDAVNEQVNEDFLQAALVEAQDFEPASDQYCDEVGNEAVTQEMVNNVVSVNHLVTTAGATVIADGTFDGATYTVVGEIPDADGQSIMDLQQNVIGVDSGVHMVSQTQAPEQEQAVQNITDIVEATDPENTVKTESPANIQLISAPATTVSPLGSSRNPIRIIQQGNQYTPVQQLTAEQLQQIMQVVQQQQLTKTTADGGGSSVLFNTQTNTKIVYRVIYPSELHKSSGGKGSGQTQSDGGNVQLMQRRLYRKRNREDDDDKVDAPELTKEEKDARKKQRPRTRSGRVSKPPKHMMKDYKHIHVLDWDEDYDDDDGGYSDFKCSDHEGEDRNGSKNEQDESSLDAGYGPLRPKKFKCSTCDKSYIGQGGLARHYRLNPSHGSIDEHEDEKEKSSENADGSIGSFSEDSNTRDSFPNSTSTRLTSTPCNSTTQESAPPTEEAITGPDDVSPAVTPQKIFYGRRGRPKRRNIYLHETPAQRQKRKLREVVKASDDEDLMEIVLPRLVGTLTLWEFLLMKVETGSPSRPHVDVIHQEFEKLYKTVHEVCKKYLQPCKNSTMESGNKKSLLKIENSPINNALELEEGLYEVKDMPMEESSDFQYTYITTDKKSLLAGTQSAHPKVRKTVAVVTKDELVNPAKQPKMTSLLTNTKSLVNTVSLPSNKQGTISSSLTSSGTPTITIITKQQPISSSLTSKAVPSSTLSISNSVVSPTVTNSLLQTPAQSVKPIFRVVSAQSAVYTKSQEIPKSQESLLCKTVLISSASSQCVSATKNSTTKPVLVIGPNSAKLLHNSNIDASVFQNPIIVNGSNMNMQSKNSTEDKIMSSSSSSLVVDSPMYVSTDSKPVLCLNGVSTQSIAVNGASEMMETSDATLVPENTELEKLAHQTVQEIVEPLGNCNSGNDTIQKDHTAMDVNSINSYDDLSLPDKDAGENTQIVTMVQQGGDSGPCEIQLDGGQVLGEVAPDFSQASLFQTEDGMYIIQNPDGMAFQLQGAEGFPLETVQALLSMESDAQLQGETVQAEIQQ